MKFSTLISKLVAISAVSLLAFSACLDNPMDDSLVITETDVKANIVNSYYSGAFGLTGDALKRELHDIIDNHQRFSYSKVWDALKELDEDPNNRNNVVLIYTRRSQSKNAHGGGSNDWNREHTWPKSHGFPSSGQPAYTDLHHMRPADASTNSSRGTKDYDNGGTGRYSEAPLVKYDTDSWEAPDAVKGDLARGLFYMAVRYEGDRSGETDLELTNNTSSSNSGSPRIGKLDTLIQWHTQDPVDAGEIARNNAIYTNWQGNRNPFIDNPSWVYDIWGGTNPNPTPNPQPTPGWTSVSKSATSPGYPSSYPNNANDSVTLSVPGASKIRVKFDAFNLESNYDFLYLLNGSGSTVATYTGNKGAFTSADVAGDTVTLRFVSDYSVNAAGYKVSQVEAYGVGSTPAPNPQPQPQPTQTWQTVTKSASSAGYPSYANNVDTTITLSEPGASKLKVSFSAFNVENGYDFVYLLDGSGNQIASYTGNKGAFTSAEVTGDTVKLRLVTDFSVTAAGFQVNALQALKSSGGSSAGTTEDFANAGSSSSYASGSFSGAGNITWNYVSTKFNMSLDGKAATLGRNRSPNATLSATFPSGVSSLNFEFAQTYSTPVNFQVFANGNMVGTVSESSARGVTKSRSLSVNRTGSTTISFVQASGGGQVTLDNIQIQ